MSTKHTPGPWAVLSDTGAVGVAVGEWKMTASVYGDHPECEPDERLAANARLIAAAPDLLDIAETIALDSTSPHQWIDELRAAIAKATGEQS
jgi:hypothetical protein